MAPAIHDAICVNCTRMIGSSIETFVGTSGYAKLAQVVSSPALYGTVVVNRTRVISSGSDLNE